MNNNDLTFMQRALELAVLAEKKGEVPVACVIAYQDKIIAEGYNQPIQSHDATAHAEIVALRQATKLLRNYRLTDCTLYVTLEPCVMCVGAMIHARIARLVFGACDPKTGAVESAFRLLDDAKHNHRVDWKGGVLADVSAKYLKDFFQKRR